MTTTAEAPARSVPAHRGFAVRLARTQRLSPSFLRLTFTGPDLDEFAPRTHRSTPSFCGAHIRASPTFKQSSSAVVKAKTIRDDEPSANLLPSKLRDLKTEDV